MGNLASERGSLFEHDNGRFRSRATLFGLSVATALIVFHANQFGERFLHLTPLQSRDLFWWPMLVAILLYVRLVEGRPLSSIGFRRPTWLTPIVGVGLALVASYPIGWVADAIVSALHLSSAASNGAATTINQMPYWYRVLLVTRAAFVEEVLFRGYMIERVEEFTGSRIAAAAFSVAFFVYAHLAYWGWPPLVFVGLAGTLSAMIYQWRRDLWANILGHWLGDALSILAL